MLKQIFLTVSVLTVALADVAYLSATPLDAVKSADSRGGLLYTNKAPISYWQTYNQSPKLGAHEFIDGEYDFHIEKLKSPASDFKTGYIFINKGALFFEDRGNNIQYKVDKKGNYTKYKFDNSSYIEYRTTSTGNYVNYKPVRHNSAIDAALPKRNTYSYNSPTHNFTFDVKTGILSACPLSGRKKCETVSVQAGTFPYVYASKNSATISITNYGDALLFKKNKWCRMSMAEDVYSCITPEPLPLTEPRKIQFYSSIAYQGQILIGEWPTGRIYEFDGAILKPSNMTPPTIAAHSDLRLGYEAQSMAEYCGDLFVGYWPKGEVWRFDRQTRHWQFFKRFFSDVEGEAFIPYSDRPADHLNSSFFGQRVTALIPYKNSLYVATSNLSAWTSKVSIPKGMDTGKIREYGSIYKVTRHGCRSTYANL